MKNIDIQINILNPAAQLEGKVANDPKHRRD